MPDVSWAEALNMHGNAVAYRVNQIFSVLDVDEGNPDNLLLLQLACRARELADPQAAAPARSSSSTSCARRSAMA